MALIAGNSMTMNLLKCFRLPARPRVPVALTAARWAHIVGGPGGWVATPDAHRMNRELMELASRRFRGEAATLTIPADLDRAATELVRRYFATWWLGVFPDDRVFVTTPDAVERIGQTYEDMRASGPTVFGLSADAATARRTRWFASDHAGGAFAEPEPAGKSDADPSVLVIREGTIAVMP